MKKNNILIIALGFLLFSCNNELKKELEFAVDVVPSSEIQVNGTEYTAPAGTTIGFDFSGNADFISFTYDRFEPTNSTLKFKTTASWGTHIENTLSVYLSKTFPGLSKTDIKADSTTVTTHQWIDITSQCNLPTAANKTQEALIPINDYRGENIIIAFLYKTEYKADYQPKWNIADLNIQNTLVSTGTETSTFQAATMGFTPFDIFNKQDPYVSSSGEGVWNLETPKNIEIKHSLRNKDLNEDWLISKSISIPLGVTESYFDSQNKSTAYAVKNMTQEVNSFRYTFQKAGVYDVRFYAANYNYEFDSSTEKTIRITITD